MLGRWLVSAHCTSIVTCFQLQNPIALEQRALVVVVVVVVAIVAGGDYRIGNVVGTIKQ